jgi:hypothetical protein
MGAARTKTAFGDSNNVHLVDVVSSKAIWFHSYVDLTDKPFSSVSF